MIDLRGKVALVTGASRGIGRACAVQLAACGANVAVNFLSSKEGAAESVRLVQAAGGQGIAVRADVSDAQDIAAAVNYVQERFGRLDIIVSNAAAGGFRPLMAVTPANWESVLRHNAAPLLWLAQAAAPVMKAQEGGKLIAISSHGSFRAFPNYGAIGASKAALESLVRHLAFELGPEGINFNCVLAGMVATEAIRSMPDSASMLKTSQDLMLLKQKSLDPEDVAGVVTFLASPLSDKIQGQTIVVDGGVSIRV
ncbi:SDR family oxidoreductase [Planctomicrobium piriforme]|uniref:Enoyl-[acyl-carrier protein] reductase III n=1 Tax=Planctomicrobium piriforme TaxID=1576369 RepID=A0A1I3DBK0_9PLAN|nr:SDR family oxidoreductase [Planctomicrobium piriforme]SFH84104.1 enoyl-[acyl-carrier protein] reductase III [Planctomicrobium piriforme]